MTEDHPAYENNTIPHTLEAFRNRPCALPFGDPHYVPPEPEEVTALIKIMGWSQKDTALITGVKFDEKGSSTVRRWQAKKEDVKNYRQIPYSAWRLLLIGAGVVDH